MYQDWYIGPRMSVFSGEGLVVCSKVEPKIGISKHRGRNLSFCKSKASSLAQHFGLLLACPKWFFRRRRGKPAGNVDANSPVLGHFMVFYSS
jgi:hypothetical protein